MPHVSRVHLLCRIYADGLVCVSVAEYTINISYLHMQTRSCSYEFGQVFNIARGVCVVKRGNEEQKD